MGVVGVVLKMFTLIVAIGLLPGFAFCVLAELVGFSGTDAAFVAGLFGGAVGAIVFSLAAYKAESGT